MRAVVLVGGYGTRLRPLTDATPKQLLTVAHRPMVEHSVGHLAHHGVTEVVLSMGFRPDDFEAAYPDGRCAGVAVRYAIEPEPLDTAGAIGFAARDAGIDETFLACNGDVLTDLDIGGLIERHRTTGAAATIALTPVAHPARYGMVPTDDNGRVLRFLEKPPVGKASTNLVNAGTYVLEPSVLDRIPPGRPVSLEREIFPAMAADGTLDILVGTQALIQEGISLPRLALAVADEQHRFGVMQRSALQERGQDNPHTLIMSATPIPRTLSLTLFGDLDISTIDEMPAGRQEVATRRL